MGSVDVVVVARKPEDIKLRLPNQVDVTGPISLNEARNIGAAKGRSEFILFVDDDNSLDDLAIEGMHREFFDPKVAVVSPIIIDMNDKFWFIGGRITPFGRFKKKYAPGWQPDGHYGKDEVYPGWMAEPTETFHDCFMVRRKAFEKVRGFDAEAFPFFMGEADMAERMKRGGWKFVVSKFSLVKHNIDPKGGIIRTSHIGSEKRAYYVARNLIIFCRRYRHLSLYLLFWFPFRTVAHLSALIWAKKWGYVRAYLRGIKDGLFG